MPSHRDVRPGPRGYKEEPAPVAGDPVHHPHRPQQGPPAAHPHHPRPSSIVHQQQHHPNSPHQPPPQGQHPGAYASPHTSSQALPLQHQSPYPQQGPGPNGQAHAEVTYYGGHPSSYPTPGPGQYSSSETPELMAAAHMQRPYPPIYHTPQSNSPASVASPQSHDQHGRAMYGQPPPQIPQGMYGYPQYPPMNQVPHPSPYAQHASQPQQHPGMPSQPLLVSHQQQNQQQMQHQQPQSQPVGMATNSPRPKLEPSSVQQQRPLDPASLQRPPSGPINPSTGPTGPPAPNNGLHQAGPGGAGANANAAPGPIPATTPLVVRQDNNGVQWIAFEYSRDRVKMQYTIRCDVESVDRDNLSTEFKQENCVYPRACCGKDQYRGNRLQYETECNTVGWALADLNPCLRGKRGLIQRAVDSWRNSNQDPKLRSRRVRRMAKMNTRTKGPAPPSHLPGPGGAPPGLPSANPMAAPGQRPPPTQMGMPGAALHHHHAHPDGSASGGPEDVSGPPSNDLRPSQIFHGYSTYPSQNMNGASMAPALQDHMDGINAHGPSSHNAIATSLAAKHENDEKTTALYGDLPESKRRKFILVDDTAKNTRVRVRVTLDQVEMKELPDSYRKSNSVYPRSYFPMQMQSPPSSASLRGSRFFQDDDPQGGDIHDQRTTLGKTLVPVPLLDNKEGEMYVPKLTRAKKRREVTLNDLGYRMSWSQSRVFAGRIMFLQKSLDAYRNKMRSTMLASSTAGASTSEVCTVAPHFETRIGKRKLAERARNGKRGGES